MDSEQRNASRNEITLRGHVIPLTNGRVATFVGLLVLAGFIAWLVSHLEWNETISDISTAALFLAMGAVFRPEARRPSFANEAALGITNASQASISIAEQIEALSEVSGQVTVPDVQLGLAHVQMELQKANGLIAQSVGPWDDVEPGAVEIAKMQREAGHRILQKMSEEQQDDE